MYLHLGQDTILRTKEILGILTLTPPPFPNIRGIFWPAQKKKGVW